MTFFVSRCVISLSFDLWSRSVYSPTGKKSADATLWTNMLMVRLLRSAAMRAEIHPEAPVGGSYMATVVIVDRVVDAASGTFGVRLELLNPAHRLPPALSVRCVYYRNRLP